MKKNKILVSVVVFFFLLVVTPFVLGLEINNMPYISGFARTSTSIQAIGNYTSTEIFRVMPPGNETWLISNLQVQVEDNGAFVSNRYGVDLSLVNGITIRTNFSNTLFNYTAILPIITNDHWTRFSHNVFISSFAANNNYLDVAFPLSATNNFLMLNGSTNDSIEIVLRDDFTSLVSHTFKYEGYIYQKEDVLKTDSGDFTMSIAIIFGLSVLIAIFIIVALAADNIFVKLLSFMVVMGFSWVMYAALLKIAEDVLGVSSIYDVLVAGYQYMVYLYIVLYVLILVYMFYSFVMMTVRRIRLDNNEI